MIEDGYIKFTFYKESNEPPKPELIEEINFWRGKLFQLGLIGVSPDGIGVGNISRRLDDGRIIITGSRTGEIPVLLPEHYVFVTSVDIALNEVHYGGLSEPSSETMTHFAVYCSLPEVKSVVHVHSSDAWNKLAGKIPTTAEGVEYGTPEMGFEILRLIKDTNCPKQQIIAMASHEDGIITFGKSVEDAVNILIDNLQSADGK